MPVTNAVRKPPKPAHVAIREKRAVDNSYWAYIAAGGIAIAACNTVSVLGQLRFAQTALRQYGLPMEILFAVACESVAVFLGMTALMADRENTPSFSLKIASTLAGLAIGALNYSHDPGTALGIVTGGFSAVCPHLWEVLGRRLAMPELLKSGVIGQHAIRLGASRWFWHPVRSFRVMYAATWDGTTDLKSATAKYNADALKRAMDKATAKGTQSLDRELAEIES